MTTKLWKRSVELPQEYFSHAKLELCGVLPSSSSHSHFANTKCSRSHIHVLPYEQLAHNRVVYKEHLNHVRATCPAAIGRKATNLPELQQIPFTLSRIAASAVLSHFTESNVEFTGCRVQAYEEHNLHLSLSHEDYLAAAIGCPLPTTKEKSALRESETKKLWSEHNSHATCENHKMKVNTSNRISVNDNVNNNSSTELHDNNRFAVDVTDVWQVIKLVRRFPQFRNRWLPNCSLPSECNNDQCNVPISSMLAHWQLEQQQQQQQQQKQLEEKYTQEKKSNTNVTAEEYHDACVLAQHWAIRECAIKLLQIPHRVFDYRCITAPLRPIQHEYLPLETNSSECKKSEQSITDMPEELPAVQEVTEHPESTLQLSLSSQLREHTVYSIRITGKEHIAFAEAGLDSNLICYT